MAYVGRLARKERQKETRTPNDKHSNEKFRIDKPSIYIYIYVYTEAISKHHKDSQEEKAQNGKRKEENIKATTTKHSIKNDQLQLLKNDGHGQPHCNNFL